MAQKSKSKRPKAKRGAWFVPVRGSYLPASAAGWWTYVPFVAYLVFTLVAGLSQTSSLATAVLFIVPNWVAAAAVLTYVAARKS
ncbi:MAG: hypothetical protein JWN38_98 [Candidatus Saccharibacteria bacterium]|nr:hypothetical protein [Candidatus Saccharibacteria bacterium]